MSDKIKILPGFLPSTLNTNKVLDIIDIDYFIKEYLETTAPICPICLNICIFPCKPNRCSHKFCYKCISIWSNNKTVCPMCRKSFTRIIKI